MVTTIYHLGLLTKNAVLGLTASSIWLRGSSFGYMGNKDYYLIARSTVTRSQDLIYSSNSSVWKLFVSDKNTWYRIHRHHHVMLLAWISLTLSCHFSLSFISSGRSSELHPVSSRSCCMYVLAGQSAFSRLYVGVHRSTSLMSSSLLLQQCPACLVSLTWIVFVMGGRWPYSWCLVGCCRQDLFNIALNILV